MKKRLYVKIVLIALMFTFITSLLSGCASGAVNYYLTRFPNKLIYEIGEKIDFTGLKVETINSDGTNTMVRLEEDNFSEVDTSTPGVKKVKISNGKLSTVFNIYVADVVVTDSDNLKEKFASAKDGDIIYLKKGNYTPKNIGDESYKDVLVDKRLVIVGDGKDKTKFGGNFIVDAELADESFEQVENFKDIKIMNIGFSLSYTTKNGLVSYNGPYGNADTKGAINIKNTQDILIFGCSFKNYAYGILGDSAKGLTVKNNTFRYIFKNGIKTTTDTQNTTIHKNIFMDIANNVVASENDSQSSLGCIELSFADTGNAGVVISNNVFTRTGLHDGSVVYYDQASKDYAEQTKEQVFSNSYINNTAIITLISSAEDDLQVDGIFICANNFGQTLTNIRLNTQQDNNVDQNGVMIIETY